MRKLLWIIISFILVACSDDIQERQGCPMFDIVPSSPYDDPIWHPFGEIIGFNHIPIKEIRYNYGYDCPHQATYVYEEDSIGFWLINTDGKDQRRVLPYTLTTPAWSPDGNWIAFSQGAQIFKMPFDGNQFDTTAIEQLTFEGRNFFPAWSPDGEQIAYNESICNDIKACGIWIKNLESGTDGIIAPYGNFPSWHPFNDSIIYQRGDSIWLYNNDTKTKERLINIPSQYYNYRYLKYSPDGTKFAFISALISGIGSQLYYTNITDGSSINRITTSGALNFSWSPDEKIVYLNFDYNRIDERKGTLWIMDADGNNKRQLTYNNFQIFQC